jgi:hypothetical protein
MMHLLLWLESVLVTALACAVPLACAMRLDPSRWRTVLLTLSAVLPPLLLLGPLTGFGIFLSTCIAGVPLLAIVGLQIAGLASGGWLLRRAWREAPWPRLRLAAGLAGAVVLLFTTFTQTEQAVLVRARARGGEVLAVAASVMPARLPDDLNAALPYVRAAKALEGKDLTKLIDSNHERTVPDDDARWAEVARALDAYAPVLADLREGGRRLGCWFERDLSVQSLFSLRLEEISGLMLGSRLLHIATRARLATGEPASAWDCVETLARLAHHYGKEPFLISRLVAAAFDSQMFAAAAACLRRSGSGGPAAAAIPEPPPWSRQLRRALVMEQAAGTQAMLLASSCSDIFPAFFTLGGEMSCPRPWISAPMSRLYAVLLLEDDIATHQALLTGLRLAAHGPWKQWRAEAQRQEDDLRRPENRHLFSSMLLPAIGQSANTFARAQAHRSLVRLALAARAHHAATGAWPTTTTAGLAWPNDPFTDTPMPAEVSEGILVLWSVGPDGKDDHGSVKDKSKAKSKDDPDDFVLRVTP